MRKILGLLSVMLCCMLVHAKEWTTIRIGVEASYPPFCMKSAEGKLIGFDIDIATALCKQMKATCTFVESDFDALIAGLNVRKFDAVIASLAITEERKKLVSFSDRYYQTPARMIAKVGSIDGSAASLKNKKMGVLRGTVQHWYARDILSKSGVKIIPYSNQNALFLDLKAGRVEVALVDMIQGEYSFLKHSEGRGFSFVGPILKDKKYFDEGIGIALRKADNDLHRQFNQALKAIRASGVYKTIQAKYFSHDIDGN